MNYSQQKALSKLDNNLRNQELGDHLPDQQVFQLILEFYLDYIDDENLGKIANSHLAFAD